MQALNVVMNTKLDANKVVAFDAEVEPTESQIYSAISTYETLSKAVMIKNITYYIFAMKPDDPNAIYSAHSM